jgi:glycosyltransferase involved in cell wall biosynthesis
LLDSPVRHLHAHFCHTPTSVALFASDLTSIPFSFTAHAKDIYISEPDQLLRKIERARFVVTCTRYNARYLTELARSHGCTIPIHTIYHGIDLGLFSFGPRSPAALPHRILSVGRLVAKKGWEDLLQALAILRGQGLDFTFTHIGSGEEEASVRALVGRLQLGSRVRMLGTLPHRDVVEHYRHAHCLALACKVAANGDRDGIPNVLVEAMAVGLPVVSTRVSAIPELLEDGVTGTLVEPGRPDLFAAAVRATLLRLRDQEAVVRAARARVERDFDNRRCVQRLHQLLKATLQA